MSVINGYQAPAPRELVEDFGPEPYDINFCFPIDFSRLESERVKLVPFLPRLHAQIYLDQVLQHPELETWLPFNYTRLAHVLHLVEVNFRQNSASVAFAVIDKGRPDPEHPEWGGSMAGVTGLIKASPENLSVEIGWVITFPAFQRTYVTSSANALLLRYCLATPDEQNPGLGLRRVQWFANAKNVPSVNTALRLGFKMEGKLRWERIIPAKYSSVAANGAPIRPGDPKPETLSRDSSLLSCCADDWANGGRELVQRILDRK
ncbi:hypothetical protein K488DRAFT_72281 [Vararia minispora EC-137]|uniref:Uncharacterized protein n=1 Tax=Vararia minispora EC-137 TaxID=1314806 RepID=A0ACB8QF76_9AGAM|nr:hypothetical protein K488DRAFT_72281 [Vararia minispora EC-137]